jgi:glutaredoxin-related protein
MTKREMLDCIHKEMARDDAVRFTKGDSEAPKFGVSNGPAGLLERVGSPFIETGPGPISNRTEARP